MKRKHITLLLLACFLAMFSGSGCATQEMLRETKTHYKYNPETKEYDELPGNKGAYAGVPFAFLWDVAASPIWLPYAICVSASGGH